MKIESFIDTGQTGPSMAGDGHRAITDSKEFGTVRNNDCC